MVKLYRASSVEFVLRGIKGLAVDGDLRCPPIYKAKRQCLGNGDHRFCEKGAKKKCYRTMKVMYGKNCFTLLRFNFTISKEDMDGVIRDDDHQFLWFIEQTKKHGVLIDPETMFEAA
jgi:hypothetical protein